MSALIAHGAVSEETRGVTFCGKTYEGICANVNGVLYKTFVTPQAPCIWVPC